MDSTKIKPWQAKLINAALRPALGYLCRLRERMGSKKGASLRKFMALSL